MRGAPERPLEAPPAARGWRRAAGLLGVTLALSVVRPSVLVGIPFVALAVVLGVRRVGEALAVALVATLVLVGAERDGVWYLERGWALLVAGWFAALSLRRPGSAFTSRALAAVAGAVAVAAAFFGLRPGSWGVVDWLMTDRMTAGVTTALDALRFVRGGEALPPALVTAVYETAQSQAAVFPALTALTSVAALGVAWWAYVRVTRGSDEGIGPLRDFRFNDHLVWVFIAGLVLLVTQWGGVGARAGSNAVVFMGALYALRGAAVVTFMSGGVSFLGYVVVIVGLVLVPPLILVGALVIGLGDTWLDIREKAKALAA